MRHEISDKVWTWEPAATLQCGCAQTGYSVAHQPMKIMFGDRHEEMSSWDSTSSVFIYSAKIGATATTRF